MTGDAGPWLVRIIHAVANEPASVIGMNHLARWLVAAKNRSLNDCSELPRENATVERKWQELEQLAVLVQGAHSARSSLSMQAR